MSTKEAISGPAARPDEEWIKGTCPVCGEVTVSNYYHCGGKGYLGVIECWASLGEKPACNYRSVL